MQDTTYIVAGDGFDGVQLSNKSCQLTGMHESTQAGNGGAVVKELFCLAPGVKRTWHTNGSKVIVIVCMVQGSIECNLIQRYVSQDGIGMAGCWVERRRHIEIKRQKICLKVVDGMTTGHLD